MQSFKKLSQSAQFLQILIYSLPATTNYTNGLQLCVYREENRDVHPLGCAYLILQCLSSQPSSLRGTEK